MSPSDSHRQLTNYNLSKQCDWQNLELKYKKTARQISPMEKSTLMNSPLVWIIDLMTHIMLWLPIWEPLSLLGEKGSLSFVLSTRYVTNQDRWRMHILVLIVQHWESQSKHRKIVIAQSECRASPWIKRTNHTFSFSNNNYYKKKDRKIRDASSTERTRVRTIIPRNPVDWR